MTSVVSQRPRDCLACRIISGGGLIGVGVYIAFQSRRANFFPFKVGMCAIALGAAGLGTTRLLNLPPFNKMQSSHEVEYAK